MIIYTYYYYNRLEQYAIFQTVFDRKSYGIIIVRNILISLMYL